MRRKLKKGNDARFFFKILIKNFFYGKQMKTKQMERKNMQISELIFRNISIGSIENETY